MTKRNFSKNLGQFMTKRCFHADWFLKDLSDQSMQRYIEFAFPFAEEDKPLSLREQLE
jgi:hypothetical protein